MPQRPSERALGLLRSVLGPEQREELDRHGGFPERTSTHLYWIPLRGRPARARLDGGPVERLCVGPDENGGMPPADVALTFLLWIRGDHPTFLDRANVVERRAIRWYDERTFCEAVRGSRRQVRRPAPPPRPVVPPRAPRPASVWRPPVVMLPLRPAPRRTLTPPPRQTAPPPPPIDPDTRAALVGRMRELRIRIRVARLSERMGTTTSPETIEAIARRLVLQS